MTEELKKKVERAVKFIQSIPNEEPIKLSYSGGKDSDVILALTKMAGVNFTAIYNNTTIDPPGTIAYVKSRGAQVLQPKRSFLKIVEAKGMPSRWRRFCCSELKERAVDGYNRVIIGIRREESIRRAQLYKEPEMCDMKHKGVKMYYPILDWTLADVKAFIEERGLRIHPLYYDDGAKLDVTRRLGCLGCPLMSKNN